MMGVYLAASLKIKKIWLETKKGSRRAENVGIERKTSNKYSLNDPLKLVIATQPFQNSPLDRCQKKGFNALGQPLLEKCLNFTPPVESEGFVAVCFLTGIIWLIYYNEEIRIFAKGDKSGQLLV